MTQPALTVAATMPRVLLAWDRYRAVVIEEPEAKDGIDIVLERQVTDAMGASAWVAVAGTEPGIWAGALAKLLFSVAKGEVRQ